MARYTVELGEIAKSGLKIFNFSYDFYDETKKADFEQKFINHFRFREIGQETVGRFQHYLKCTCDEKLPYYNMLFRTALVDYEKTINYNTTETFTRNNAKTNQQTGSGTSQGNTTGTANGTINTNRDSTITNDNDVDSTVTTSNTGTETNILDKTNLVKGSTSDNTTVTLDSDNKRVESDTPNGLLAMSDIKTNVYASKATIEDNLQTNTTKGTTLNTEEVTGKDTNNVTSHDNGSVTTKENNSANTNENTDETQTSNQTTGGTFNSNNTSNVNGNETESENFTRTIKGSYGVITEADMLKKHIDLQQTLTTIMSKFFDECDDLFMQVY